MTETKTEVFEQKVEQKKELKGGLGEDIVVKATPIHHQSHSPTPLPPKEPDVQSLVNELFIRHGANLPERGDYPDLLESVSLKVNQVKSKHLELGMKAYEKMIEEETGKAPPPRDNKLNWVILPSEEKEWMTVKSCHFWQTEDGRYRVYRVLGMDEVQPKFTSQYRTHKGGWDACEFEAGTLSSPKYLKSLELALSQVEKYHGERAKVALVASNREEVLVKAVELGLASPVVITPKPKEAGDATPSTGSKPSQKASGTPRAPRGSFVILGHSLSRVVHWMGSQGWNYERILRALSAYKVEVGKEEGKANPVSVRTYFSDSKNPTYLKPAVLTQEQADELNKIV
jgi:hypothetical protein